MSVASVPVLHGETSGEGTPLVLLHGWGLNLRVWDGLARRLGGDVHALRLDLPGHGRSRWPFAEGAGTLEQQAQLIAAAIPPRCALLGWSLGGQIALRIAKIRPHQVQRLVLIATTPRFVTGAGWPHGVTAAILNGFAARLEQARDETVRDFLELQVRGSAGASSVLAELQRALLDHGPAAAPALAAGLAILRTADLREELAGITQPALVLAGQYDRMTPPAAARALAQALPGGLYHEVRRGAHAPFLSHPAEVAAQLRAFLGTPRPSRRVPSPASHSGLRES